MTYLQVGSVVAEGSLRGDATVSIGETVRSVKGKGFRVERSQKKGDCLIYPSTHSPGIRTNLLVHLCNLADSSLAIRFDGIVEHVAARKVTLRLNVFFPAHMTENCRDAKNVSFAHLFLNMIPLSEESCPPFDAEPASTRSLSAIDALRVAAGEDPNSPVVTDDAEVNSLRSCILAIPPKAETLKLSPLTCAQPGLPSLADLPLQAITQIMAMVDSETLQVLACTCRHMRELAADIGPGLLLALYPHQREAIRWMLHREMPPEGTQHPTLRRFSVQKDGEVHHFWGDTATGQIIQDAPLPLQDFRGGLFCDEPGLGKTITSLGLVLRTKGTLPEPPENTEVTWFNCPTDGLQGRPPKLGFYLVSHNDATRANRVERATATELVRRSSRFRKGDGEALFWGLDSDGVTPLLEKPEVPGWYAKRNAARLQRAENEEVKKEEEITEAVGAVVGIPGSDTEIKDERMEDAGPAQEVQRGGSYQAAKRQKVNGSKDGGPSATSPFGSLPTPHGRDSCSGLRKGEPRSGDNLSRYPSSARGLSSREGSGPSAGPSQAPAVLVQALNSKFNATDRDQQQQQQADGGSNGTFYKVEETSDDNGEPSGSGSGQSSFVSEDDWVQCELCTKWRRVPVEHHPPPNNLWCCYQHPLAGYRSCAIGADEILEDEQTFVTRCPGWRREDEEPGSEDNVDFFRHLLSKYESLGPFFITKLVCTWLRPFAEGDPTSFTVKMDTENGNLVQKGGIILQREVFRSLHYAPDGFGQFLAEMGFVPLKSSPGVGTSSGRGNSHTKFQVRPSNLPENQRDWIAWQQPSNLWGLLLDQKALKTALLLGGAPKAQRVYLSPATLIVVPTELVNHWKEQIFWHTRPGALRVAVYEHSKNRTLSDFKDPPAPYHLAWDYDVIITTFNKMSSDWDSTDPIGCSPLAQVHWLRIILDEGHTLSPGVGSITNKLLMATALRAERRWIMTGTPAPSTTPLGNAQLRHMQPLMSFLHDQALGESPAWSHAIEKQFSKFPVAPRWRLQAALRRCLIRASKAELLKLPALKRNVVLLRFAPSHAKSYNHFVDLVRLNLLQTDWFDPDHNESLLNINNATHATQTLNNLAQSCNVAGNIKLQVGVEQLFETLEMLADANAIPQPNPLAHGFPFCPPGHPLYRVERGLTEGGPCNRCQAHTRCLVVTPCTCLLCVDCAVQDRTKCPHCAAPYKMQGVDHHERRRDEQGTVNPNPKWAVPRDLIEIQPAFVQHGATGAAEGYWQDTWKSTESTKLDYLIRKLREIGALPPKGWNPTARGTENAVQTWPATGLAAPRKAIIFSQFELHASFLMDRLMLAVPESMADVCIATYYRNLTQQQKAEALAQFRRDPCCGVLVMDESGALGLDLSFVQYVFLAEPIANKSLEQQVVSRAHRMGAKEEVHVQVLAMHDTYEEEILIRNGDIDDRRTNQERHLFDDGGELEASGSGSGSQSGKEAASNSEAERRRYLTAMQVDRNVYLKALKPVRKVTDASGDMYIMK